MNYSSESSIISALILDLDGTLLNTENIFKEVLEEFLAKHGKEVDVEKMGKKRVGKTLRETAATVVHDYDIPLTPEQFIDEILPLFPRKWAQVVPMPGAERLIKHLYKHGVPFALASNSRRESIDQKISHHKDWSTFFSVILGSDQVQSGKPAPDLFLEAAVRMGMTAAECLVIEDSLVGVKAAVAAKMKVVAVPSPGESDCSLYANCVLNSLTEFRPEDWGLPPYDDGYDESIVEHSCNIKENCESEINGLNKSSILETNGHCTVENGE